MADELKLRKKTQDAAKASALLDNELLKEAFTSLEADYMKAWRNTMLTDQDARERLWQAVHLLNKVQDHLKKVVVDGKIAQSDLDTISLVRT